jgi:spore photoproduct lyase
MKTVKKTAKNLKIRESFRSSDYISPNFIYECGLDCAYCYVKRHNQESITVYKNNGDILTAINNHVTWLPPKTPNQTHHKYYTYDIGCSSDIGLHRKQINWKYIFQFFKDHPTAMATFATKVIPTDFLSFNPEGKVRIRFSLMPQRLSSELEKGTPDIIDRIKAIDKFIDAEYDVHINFSPIIVCPTWLEEYEELFRLVDSNVKNKDKVFSECIFLTHNETKHKLNLIDKSSAESILWRPNLQEVKTSQYGGENVRYKRQYKSQYIKLFRDLHDSIIKWNKIRYIF